MLIFNTLLLSCIAEETAKYPFIAMAKGYLNVVGLDISNEMIFACNDLMNFSEQHKQQLTKIGHEFKDEFVPRRDELFRMIDNLFVGRNKELYDEILKFASKSSESDVMTDYLNKIQRIYRSTIEANKEFCIAKLTSTDSVYMNMPLEYRAVVFLALSDLKSLIQFFTIFNAKSIPIFALYDFLSKHETGIAASKIYKFISDDVGSNLFQKPELNGKAESVRKFYGKVKEIAILHFPKITAGTFDVSSFVQVLLNEYAEFQNELANHQIVDTKDGIL